MIRSGGTGLACAIALALGVAGGANAQSIPLAEKVESNGTLTIASGLDYAPMQFVDEKGQPAGMNVEMAQAVAKLLGVELEIVTIPFKAQIPALVSERADIGWAGYTILPERLEQVDFVGFMSSGTVIVGLPETKDGLADPLSICGKKVAVANGNAADAVADRLSADCEAGGLAAIEKQIFPDQKDTIQALLTGRVDARLDDATSAGYYEATTNGKNVVASDPIDPAPLGLAIRKGDSAMGEMLSSALNALMADGTYATILEKYGMSAAAVTESVVYSDMSQLQN
ncbi:ABC transporter substrate-binding protein [Paracoccus sp. XHP0099]|uniref:ABC transporter substrate-binding protein n=2 Tax=Paracoccus marinaquae TaxID=2841926 RepID=A0ABS6AKE8_9RHOB|nr:ABC transporter substrate-binding protein [Paracoccus marinaquae]MBU3031070.1 ABC transporter substrate-binding protein [Paracoccus marinaquae]